MKKETVRHCTFFERTVWNSHGEVERLFVLYVFGPQKTVRHCTLIYLGCSSLYTQAKAIVRHCTLDGKEMVRHCTLSPQ